VPSLQKKLRPDQRDGIVCLRGLFDADWVTLLRESIDEDKANPSGLVKSNNEEGATGNFFSDTFIWHHINGFKRAVFDSPGAEITVTLMSAKKINVIFNQILVKEPGTSTRTL